eukprot:CAMPEP_0198589296 /NCGR_PEP_ID=MMETSP1462-20131121/134189_1 /TAXON_ID=1333877 /ORGANISM="Brandtodinium nutriculum, Strain RCC3387" /LENGTH=118 /DNA_ID=CAMNT_0044320809 /DNA_START=26 /DNA_END=382 /DNA_ORIENTATION=-
MTERATTNSVTGAGCGVSTSLKSTHADTIAMAMFTTTTHEMRVHPHARIMETITRVLLDMVDMTCKTIWSVLRKQYNLSTDEGFSMPGFKENRISTGHTPIVHAIRFASICIQQLVAQ